MDNKVEIAGGMD